QPTARRAAPGRAIAVTPPAPATGTATSDGAPHAPALLGSAGGASGNPATPIDSITLGVQPSTGTPVQRLGMKRQLPSVMPSMSHVGSPSVQTTPLSPSVASTPSKATRQSLSAFPPPRTKASSSVARAGTRQSITI